MPLDQRHVTEPEFTQHSRLFSDLGNLLVNNAVGFCSSSVYFGNSLLQVSGLEDEAVCSSREKYRFLLWQIPDPGRAGYCRSHIRGALAQLTLGNTLFAVRTSNLVRWRCEFSSPWWEALGSIRDTEFFHVASVPTKGLHDPVHSPDSYLEILK